MSLRDTAAWEKADKAVLWHPFTPMRQWCAADHHPTVLCRGEGVWLYDTSSNRYFDGNSSIWTNIHGHAHPRLLEALARQSRQLCHSSFLGATNVPAIELAETLVASTQPSPLKRVFYSDNGSTAIEVALKMTCQYHQMTQNARKRVFISFDKAYHGDTMGASSLGGVPLFFDRFSEYHFPSKRVRNFMELDDMSEEEVADVAAVVIEPVIQGVAGMRPWPVGMLRQLREWCDRHQVLLIFDEVMTGFGRTGTLYACQREGVWPDFLCLAKGLTGGTMPLAATLMTEPIYEAFLGEFAEQKTFYYGHSYTGNPLGCAVALESMRIFDDESTLLNVNNRAKELEMIYKNYLKESVYVSEIRQVGLISAVQIVRDRATGKCYSPEERIGARICEAAKARGLMTRNILDAIIFMPPPCVKQDDMSFAVERLFEAIDATLGR